MTWGPFPVRTWEASSPVGDVADVVQGFGGPVAADPPGEVGGASLGDGQASWPHSAAGVSGMRDAGAASAVQAADGQPTSG